MKNENTYETWRVMAGSDSQLKLSNDCDTPEQALNSYFEESTPEEMNEKNHVLVKAVVYADEEHDNNDVAEILEEYSLEDMIKDNNLSEYLLDNFDAEYLTELVTSEEEIEIE